MEQSGNNKKLIAAIVIIVISMAAIITYVNFQRNTGKQKQTNQVMDDKTENATVGREEYRGFLLDNVLVLKRKAIFITMYIFRILMMGQRNMPYT